MNDVAIQVTDLSKCYQIYEKPSDRLKQYMLPRLARPFPFLKKVFPSHGSSESAYYKEFWALRGASFEVKKGETVGILGRNGSGKSTLLQMICGTLSPTSGSVVTHGRIAALLELGSGFNFEFTGRENVYMNGAILGLEEEEIDARFDDIAAFADIGPFIEQPVKTYSSGMFLRLAFAVNILSTPQIMIVDEALAVGDMAFQAKCMTALTRLQDGGATVLFVSHDISALKSLCSRGVYLDRGVIQEIGAASDVAEHYNRRMREEMNADAALSHAGSTASALRDAVSENAPLEELEDFKISAEFEKRAAQFRYGDGGAKMTFAELLNENFQPVSEVAFNQDIYIRVYFESAVTDDRISLNYYVLDEKKNYILGSDVLLAGHKLLSITPGSRHVVTYKTRLPLHDGRHSIQLELTSVLVDDHSARFLDVIDDAIVFMMERRESNRLWARAFVENSVEINSLKATS